MEYTIRSIILPMKRAGKNNGKAKARRLVSSEVETRNNGMTITQKFADDVPVNSMELAETMRVSRATVYRWRAEGYRYEFGNRTTAGHLKQWLRSQADKPKASQFDLEKELLRYQ